MTFIHLHRHSRWSLLDGSGTGAQYAERAIALGQHALAITDHGTLAGCLEHYQSCRDNDITPIMGVEVYFRPNRILTAADKVDGLDKNGKKIKKYPQRYHLTLLALDFNGWVNLQRLTSEAYQTGMIDFGDKPCVDWDLLARYNEGIYCLGGCFASILSQEILNGGMYTSSIISKFRSIYGDNFGVEIMPHDWDNQRQLNIDTVNVAYQYGVPIMATGDTHYPFKEWASTQDILVMLKTKQTNKKRDQKKSNDEEFYTLLKENPTLYLMDDIEMATAFAQFHPQLHPNITDAAIHQTGDILQKITPFVLDRAIKMPKFSRERLAKIDPITAFYEGEPDDIVKLVVKRWCKEGLDELEKIYPASHWEKFPRAVYETQLEHEFDTFDQIGMHVWRYMMMAGGEVRWTKREKISVGPGRGSAPGSLVAYLTKITGIDPIPYDLMFERFINPSRKGMPDIDIDFMPGARGRDLVEAHTASVYDEGNEKNVIKIAAYATYGPKAALRGICRVFDDVIDFRDSDRLVKVLDILKPTDKIDLPECAERFPEIAEFKKRFPMLWEQAVRIEGSPYSHSSHASGVLVKPTEIQVPTARKKDQDTELGVTTTAWPDTNELLANMGFLKLDYLVIEGLERQYEIINALKERENTIVDLDLLPIRWDPFAVDPEVMDIFHKGMTLGVWQFEGRGTIPVLKSVRPDNMHDLAAINALIRPGSRSAGDTEMYAKLKNGLEPITYWHDAVEPFLKKTHGLMIYQEQVMEVAVALGGFTRTEADDLRKAMGKKYRQGMAAVEKYLDELGFAPKFIHNASGMVGEESATMIWKKTLAKGGYSFNASHSYSYSFISYHDAMFKKIAPADFYAGYLSKADSKELPTRLAASIREGSRFDVKVKPPEINTSKYGFSVIDRKTILYGVQSVKGVGPEGVKSIFDNRPFSSYVDFIERVPARAVNKNAKEALVGSGAFDAFGLRTFMSEEERGANEEKYIGMRLSGKTRMEEHSDLLSETVHTEDEFDSADHGEFMCIGGEITGIKETVTKKKGEPMGFVNIAFGADTFRATLFPPAWAMYSTLMVPGNIILMEGKKDVSRQYGPGFICNDAMTLEQLVEREKQNSIHGAMLS